MTETTIHYPTDASLLWDSGRAPARLWREGRALAPDLAGDHRFHDGKTKRAFGRIVRYSRSRTASETHRRRRRERRESSLVGPRTA